MMEQWKAAIVDEAATHKATEIMNELMASTAMIEALLQEPWLLALREINRRYECATYNQDGEKWIYFPQGTHDSNAVFKVQKLFPGIITIEKATAAEVTHALNHG